MPGNSVSSEAAAPLSPPASRRSFLRSPSQRRISRPAPSPSIVAVEPTVEGIVGGLRAAVARLDRPRAETPIRLPATWDEALRDTVPAALEMFRDCVRPG